MFGAMGGGPASPQKQPRQKDSDRLERDGSQEEAGELIESINRTKREIDNLIYSILEQNSGFLTSFLKQNPNIKKDSSVIVNFDVLKWEAFGWTTKVNISLDEYEEDSFWMLEKFVVHKLFEVIKLNNPELILGVGDKKMMEYSDSFKEKIGKIIAKKATPGSVFTEDELELVRTMDKNQKALLKALTESREEFIEVIKEIDFYMTHDALADYDFYNTHKWEKESAFERREKEQLAEDVYHNITQALAMMEKGQPAAKFSSGLIPEDLNQYWVRSYLGGGRILLGYPTPDGKGASMEIKEGEIDNDKFEELLRLGSRIMSS